MKEQEQVAGKEVIIKTIFGNQFSGRTGIIKEVDNDGFNVLLDLGVSIYFNESDIELL